MAEEIVIIYLGITKNVKYLSTRIFFLFRTQNILITHLVCHGPQLKDETN